MPLLISKNLFMGIEKNIGIKKEFEEK